MQARTGARAAETAALFLFADDRRNYRLINNQDKSNNQIHLAGTKRRMLRGTRPPFSSANTTRMSAPASAPSEIRLSTERGTIDVGCLAR
jgi:hypothetical protein